MKIATVVGARPQFVKAAMVSRALVAHQSQVQQMLIHTGQHYDANMSDVFFDEMSIPKPDYHLGIGGGSHGQNTGRMLEKIEAVLVKENPDWLLVYGDTDSTLAGALAAVKLHIPVAHVEAGLRSFNRAMPEEINRVVTDHVSSLLFVPTQTAMQQLAEEGIAAEKCHNVGDVMLDAAVLFGERARQSSRVLDDITLKAKQFILVTVHRAENTNDRGRLIAILTALAEMGKKLAVVWPIHPRTKKLLVEHKLDHLLGEGVHLLDPVGYLDMVMLEQNAAVIVTDSGGVQKEAFFYQVPCVTIRDETEWVELVKSGWNQLVVPLNAENIQICLNAAMGTKGEAIQPYGSGNASSAIVNHLLLRCKTSDPTHCTIPVTK